MRVVLDANVLVSALLTPKGPPAKIVRAWLDGAFELVVSPRLLEEIERVFAYPKIATRISIEDAERTLELLADAMSYPDEASATAPVVADPEDAYLVALAECASAVLVSGDAALLALVDRMPVMPQAAFVERLAL